MLRVFEPLRYMHVDGLSPRIVMYIFVAEEWLHSSSQLTNVFMIKLLL